MKFRLSIGGDYMNLIYTLTNGGSSTCQGEISVGSTGGADNHRLTVFLGFSVL
jgi:hypothetical protein